MLILPSFHGPLEPSLRSSPLIGAGEEDTKNDKSIDPAYVNDKISETKDGTSPPLLQNVPATRSVNFIAVQI